MPSPNRRENAPGPKKVLVASDFSPIANRALEYARSLAHAFGASVTVLHVVPPVLQVEGIDAAGVAREAESWARRQAEKLSNESDRVVIVHGTPAECIVREARRQRADLIVLGSRGLSGWKKWILGSVAQQVIQSAPCPVLVVSKGVRVLRRRGGTLRSSSVRR